MYTPDKNPGVSDAPRNEGTASDQGDFENTLVNHIQCELAMGLASTRNLRRIDWLYDWGTTITHTITVEDQSGVSPGISTVQPIASAAIPFSQYMSQSIGANGSANALRTETIQYTFRNSDIEKLMKGRNCFTFAHKPFIEGDLKLREFIFDHAEVATAGNAGSSVAKVGDPVFNAFSEEITFVATIGASVTPTWKLARFTANTSTNLLVTQRTSTNDLVVTVGPLKEPDRSTRKNPHPQNLPLQLTDQAMSQHVTRVQASAIAVSIQGQAH